jgi:hypothetical protein
MVLGHAVGLCDAVILSKPRSPFLRRVMKSYKNFDGSSDQIWKTAQEHAENIVVLDYDAFFLPVSVGIESLFM